MDFQSMLQRGLGRAVIFLQSQDAKHFREDILHACSHFIGYDAQTEPSRGQYLFDLIQATGEPEFYVPYIRAMLRGDVEAEMPSQVFELAVLLAKNGDSQMRVTMYQAFARNAARQDYTGAEELVDAGGIQAYQFIAEQWLHHPLAEDDQWFEGWLLEEIEKRLGFETVKNAFAQIKLVNPKLGSYLIQARERLGTWKAGQRNRPTFVMPNYETLQEMIANPQETTRWPYWRRFGKKADEETLLRLAQDLLAETDRGPLLKSLHLFRERRFPLEPSGLLELARRLDEEIATAARYALAHITESEVRRLALELTTSSARPWEGVRMLASNYQQGDYTVLENVLAQDLSADEIHWLGYAIRDVVKANPTSDALNVLILLYEQQPCLLCRNRVVKQIMTLDLLPEWIQKECHYDADLGTREIVAESLN